MIKAIKNGKGFKSKYSDHPRIVLRNILKLKELVKFHLPTVSKKVKKAKKSYTIIEKRKVGVLNEPISLVGYIKAEIGHTVYEINDYYVVYLKREKPLHGDVLIEIEIRYYKSSLKEKINFDAFVSPSLVPHV